MQLKFIFFAICSGFLAVAAWSDAATRLGGEGVAVPLPLVTGGTSFNPAKAEREALFTRSLSAQQQSKILSQAKRSIAAEPLSATALWAWSAEQPGKAKEHGLKLAEQITRRELGVQMEWFRINAEHGNLGASFRHLDRALTIYPDAGPAMLGGLAQALAVEKVRTPLASYGSRPWFGGLINQAVSKASSSLDISALMTEANVKGADFSPGTLPRVLGRMVKEGEGFEAGQLALRMGALGQNGLEEFGIGDNTMRVEARPLSWQLPSTGGISGALQQTGQMTFAIEPGRSGNLLERVTIYRPGTYNLTQSLSGSDSRILLIWELRCLDGISERIVWSQAVPLRSEVQRSSARVTVPDGCPAQRWTLKGAASDLQMAGEIALGELDLVLTSSGAD